MIDKIYNLFSEQNEIRLVDNFISYEREFISAFDENRILKLNEQVYSLFNKALLELNYEWTFEIEELQYLISDKTYAPIDSRNFENGDEITVVLKIYKKGKYIFVFNEESFFDYLQTETLHSLFSYFQRQTGGIIFKNTNVDFKQSNSFLGFNEELKPSYTNKVVLSTQCNFKNYSDFKFNPGQFHLPENPANNPLLQLITKLHFALLIIYIFDVTEISGNIFNSKLRGYKAFDYDTNFKDLDTSSLKVYNKIYDS